MCWELNSGPLEEQCMILFTEPSLQRLYFRIFLNNFLNYEYMCVGVGRVVRSECKFLRRPEEGTRFPGAGVRSSCKLLGVDAAN